MDWTGRSKLRVQFGFRVARWPPISLSALRSNLQPRPFNPSPSSPLPSLPLKTPWVSPSPSSSRVSSARRRCVRTPRSLCSLHLPTLRETKRPLPFWPACPPEKHVGFPFSDLSHTLVASSRALGRSSSTFDAGFGVEGGGWIRGGREGGWQKGRWTEAKGRLTCWSARSGTLTTLPSSGHAEATTRTSSVTGFVPRRGARLRAAEREGWIGLPRHPLTSRVSVTHSPLPNPLDQLLMLPSYRPPSLTYGNLFRTYRNLDGRT